jgi:hypothetical protein
LGRRKFPPPPKRITYWHLRECDYRQGLGWWMDLLTTYTTRNYKQLQRHH